MFSSVAQSCPTLHDPMNCSTPGFPVHHQLSELAQTQVHWVGDVILPSHPLSSPSPPKPFKAKLKVKSLSCIQLFVTLWTVAYEVPPSMEFSPAKVLEWVAGSFSRGSSQPRDWTWVSSIASRLFYHLSHQGSSNRGSLWPHGLYSPWNSPGQNTGVGNCSLLQRIFPTPGSNSGLLHCRRILYQLSHKGSPNHSSMT